MTAFVELLKKRRSIRDFEQKEVSTEIVEELIKDSCLAPSAGNSQPWRFIIIKDREVIKKLSDENKRNLLSHLEKNPDAPTKNYEAALRDPSFNVYYNAPCLVFIVGSKSAMNLYENCALAACYFMFSAADRGLGTCWIGLGKHLRDPGLLKLIGMPEDHYIVAPIVVGYPKTIPDSTERMAPQIFKLVDR